MDLSLDTLNLGDGTRLGEVPTLQGLDFSTMEMGQAVRGKSRQYVRFYKKKVPEIYATKVQIDPKTGSTKVLETAVREIEHEMVHIVTPGDKNEFDDRANDYHRQEYWPQYKAFREGKGIPLGMPLEQVEFLFNVPGVVNELKIKGCYTLEQLADASDLLCDMIPDGHLYRNYARTAVKANLSNANLAQVNALQAEVERLTKVVSQLTDSKGAPLSSAPEMEREVTVTAGGRPNRK